MEYFISRSGKIHGPTPERELRTWLAYGSLKADDLVRRSDEEEWFPVKLFPEFAAVFEPATEKPRRWFSSNRPKVNARAVRLRDFKHVAEEQRSGVVIWRLITGFLFRPITFWRTAGAVFSSYIYHRTKTSDGLLRIWPRWTETVVTVLVVLHAVLWTGVAFYVIPRTKTITRAVVHHAQDMWHETIATQPLPSETSLK